MRTVAMAIALTLAGACTLDPQLAIPAKPANICLDIAAMPVGYHSWLPDRSKVLFVQAVRSDAKFAVGRYAEAPEHPPVIIADTPIAIRYLPNDWPNVSKTMSIAYASSQSGRLEFFRFGESVSFLLLQPTAPGAFTAVNFSVEPNSFNEVSIRTNGLFLKSFCVGRG